MNEHHEMCGGPEWRALIRDEIVPWAFGDGEPTSQTPFDGGGLGDDVLEVGPGYGATTDVFRERLQRLTSVEIDPDLASALRERLVGTNVEVIEGDATAMDFEDGRFTGAVCFTMLHHVPTGELQDRLFGEVARVLQPKARFVLSDSRHREELEAFHDGDTYNPIDPATIDARLVAAGFVDVEVRTNEYGWTARARRG